MSAAIITVPTTMTKEQWMSDASAALHALSIPGDDGVWVNLHGFHASGLKPRKAVAELIRVLPRLAQVAIIRRTVRIGIMTIRPAYRAPGASILTPRTRALRAQVYARVEYGPDKLNPHKGNAPCLSITGVIGPRASGNCLGSAGQCADTIREHKKLGGVSWAKGWGPRECTRFLDVWDRWHLNDMTAGSPAQEEYLRAHPIVNAGGDHYTKACAALKEAGLNPDAEYIHEGKPYSYGRAWLREEVPADVVAFLAGLPDADIPCPWNMK